LEHYCSTKCQYANRKGHKAVCNVKAGLLARSLNIVVRRGCSGVLVLGHTDFHLGHIASFAQDTAPFDTLIPNAMPKFRQIKHNKILLVSG
jgi:hypothetical protein